MSTAIIVSVLALGCVPPVDPGIKPPVQGPVTPAPVPTPKPTPPVDSPVTAPDQKMPAELKELLEQHNAERGDRGLAPLTAHPALNAAASKHATWMAANNTMSHTGAGKSSVSQRVRAEGVTFNYVGENIANGYPNPTAVFKGWMGSSGHRANIYNRNYTNIGLGVASRQGKKFWCVVFAGKLQAVAAVDDPTLTPDPIEMSDEKAGPDNGEGKDEARPSPLKADPPR